MQTTTPGAFQENEATKQVLQQLGTVSNALTEANFALMGAKRDAAAASASTTGGAATIARLSAVQRNVTTLQEEQRRLQQRMASADSVPKQVHNARPGMDCIVSSRQLSGCGQASADPKLLQWAASALMHGVPSPGTCCACATTQCTTVEVMLCQGTELQATHPYTAVWSEVTLKI